jgi:hypothetical protein
VGGVKRLVHSFIPNVLKNFGWRLTVKYHARPVIESPFGFGYFALGKGIKVDAFRKIFTG